LSDTSTQSKVTKLSKSPDCFCEVDKKATAESNVVKADVMSDCSEAISAENVQEHSDNNNSAKSFILKTANKILNFSKTAAKCTKKAISRFTGLFAAIDKKALKGFCNNLKNNLTSAAKSLRKKIGVKFFIVSGMIAVCLVVCSLTCSFGYKVTVNGRTLGIISSVDDYNKIYEEINKNVFEMTGESFKLPADAKISLTFAPNRSFQSEEQFAENLKSVSTDMIPAYTVVIDDKMIVALPSQDMAVSAVSEYKNAFSSGLEDAAVEFANDVEVCYMFAPKALLRSKDSAVTFLLNGEFSYYKSDSDQTVTELAQKVGISEGIILKSNILDNNMIYKNQTLKLYSGNMFVDVKAVTQSKREEAIPFETISQDSNEIYEGVTKIETAGEDGVVAIDERITFVNGIEVERDVLSKNILKKPTTQVELVGTKEPPPSIGTGSLAMPTSGSVSSRFGSRWGRQHEGIDLSASTGTPIYAADNGIVTYSRFNDGGYGYMIQIDHGNSLKTYYAHCSELLVSEGDVVAKGDLIAKVGSTGRSTGAHLHFEVRQDGMPIDPFTYLN